MKQFRIFDSTVLAATVYDSLTLYSIDHPFVSPGAFCTVGTENGIVILGCYTES